MTHADAHSPHFHPSPVTWRAEAYPLEVSLLPGSNPNGAFEFPILAAALAMSGALEGATFGTIMSAGATALVGGGVVAGTGVAMAGGGIVAGTATTIGVGAAMAGAAIGGAVGSIASQEVGIAIGAQKDFSWSQVGMSALGSAATAGVGAEFSGTAMAANGANAATGSASWAAAAGRAMVANAETQGVEVLTGMEHRFDWGAVATAGASSYVGSAVASGMNDELDYHPGSPGQSYDFGKAITSGTVSGFAAGVTSSALYGGRVDVERAAIDAFGNALGQGLADEMTPQATPAPASPRANTNSSGTDAASALQSQAFQMGAGPVNTNGALQAFGWTGDFSDWNPYLSMLGAPNGGTGSQMDPNGGTQGSTSTSQDTGTSGSGDIKDGVQYTIYPASMVQVQGRPAVIGEQLDPAKELALYDKDGHPTVVVPSSTNSGDSIIVDGKFWGHYVGDWRTNQGVNVSITPMTQEQEAAYWNTHPEEYLTDLAQESVGAVQQAGSDIVDGLRNDPFVHWTANAVKNSTVGTAKVIANDTINLVDLAAHHYSPLGLGTPTVLPQNYHLPNFQMTQEEREYGTAGAFVVNAWTLGEGGLGLLDWGAGKLALRGVAQNEALLSATPKIMQTLSPAIQDAGLTLDEFNNLRSLPADTLTDTQAIAMKSVRNSIPTPTDTTMLSKVVPDGAIDK